jgi:aryl-alcohol dehydrogenase-like predicted oxidoreductase
VVAPAVIVSDLWRWSYVFVTSIAKVLRGPVGRRAVAKPEWTRPKLHDLMAERFSAPRAQTVDPGPVAVGTWSGGRFMRFGEPLDDERFLALIAPDESIRTVMTADVYGTGEADRMLGRAIAGRAREEMCIVGAVGHDFYTGERDGPKGFPRFTDRRLRDESGYGDYLRMATERSLERCGIERFDLLLLHNPDRTGYTSARVWEGMAALREQGLTRLIGVAPGPANGFTLDLIDCLERFGELLDWAMIILNPLEPWPGELCLDAAAAAGVKVITRVVDYGGLFFDDVLPGQAMAPHDHRSFRPAGWIERGRERLDRMRPIAERAGLTMIQLACQWNQAHEPVACVVPTLIQEAGPGARPVESKRAELAGLPSDLRLTAEDVEEIRAIGDNSGCMALKGASPEHTGEERPDRWDLDDHLTRVAERWGIAPERDLTNLAAHV